MQFFAFNLENLTNIIDDCRNWQVTILGESAGSCSVFLQTVSVFPCPIFLVFCWDFSLSNILVFQLSVKQVPVSASQHWVDSPSYCSKWRQPRSRYSHKTATPQWQSNTNIAGLGNNPKSQERAFQLGETLANLLGCQVKLLDLIKFTFALFISGRTWYLALLPPGDWRWLWHFGRHGLWTVSQYWQGLPNQLDFYSSNTNFEQKLK